jgi:hypothetical protein
MKTKSGLFLLLGLIVAACLSNKEENLLSIKGLWIAAQPGISYVALNFDDSTAVFDNRGDTINHFRYAIDQGERELVLTDPFGKRRNATILKLTDDSLVFNCLWDLNTVQRFYKSKK